MPFPYCLKYYDFVPFVKLLNWCLRLNGNSGCVNLTAGKVADGTFVDFSRKGGKLPKKIREKNNIYKKYNDGKAFFCANPPTKKAARRKMRRKIRSAIRAIKATRQSNSEVSESILISL